MPDAQANFKQVPDARDRREHPRSASFWLTCVELGEENGGIVLNISESGLAVTAAEPLEEEFCPRLRFRLPKSEEWIETNAHVVWTDSAKKGAGVQFVDLGPSDRERIRNWVSTAGKFVDLQERRMLAGQAEHQLAEMSRKWWLKRTPAPQTTPTAQSSTLVLPQTETAELGAEPLLQPERRRRVELFASATARANATPPEAKRRNALLVLGGVVVLGLIFFAMGVGLGKGLFDKWLGRYAKAEPSSYNSPVATEASSPTADDSGGASPATKNAGPEKKAKSSTQTPTDATRVPGASNSPKQKSQSSVSAPLSGERAAAKQAPSPVFATAPGEGESPFRLALPEQAVSASSSLAISSQLSVLVPADPGPDSTHKPKLLQAGPLVYHVDPVFSLPQGQKGIDGTVKLRASIGKDGVVNEVKVLSGPAELLAPSVNAVRQWRYAITTLEGQPTEATADITIEYRPSR